MEDRNGIGCNHEGYRNGCRRCTLASLVGYDDAALGQIRRSWDSIREITPKENAAREYELARRFPEIYKQIGSAASWL